MRLCKIKNKYLFKSNNPEGNHTYAVYYDKNTKETRAVALTHVYVKDEKRFEQVKRGNIKLEKFKDFEVPSGVQNYYYSKNINGGKIDLKAAEVVYVPKKHIDKLQAQRIIQFAKNNYNK